jgi:HPt (histidine-containing phosphotransfer) domain-containing protein
LYRVVESLGGRAERPAIKKAALGKLGNDSANIAELAGLFRIDCPKQMAAIRTALAGSDAPGLRLAAHALKGAAMALGANSVCEAAARLESLGKASDVAGARQVLPVLEAEVERLMTALASLTAAGARK